MRLHYLDGSVRLGLAVICPLFFLGCNTAATISEAEPEARQPDSQPLIRLVVPEPDSSATMTPQSLTIGDPAPSLILDPWIKGNAIEGFQSGNVYVVEFWATWCGPCRVSMPHISQLQTDYGEQVTMVGISDESEDVVREFLAAEQNAETGATWGDVVNYRIALDRAAATSNAYMRAANQNGIPTAFIVGRDGHIEWIGHPLQLDEPLTQVVAGEWDRAAALAKFQTQQKADQLVSGLQIVLAEARKSNDWSRVHQFILDAERDGISPQIIERLKMDVALLSQSFDEANSAAERLAEHLWDNAHQLNSVAWKLVTRIPHASQDHELALRVANRAGELTEHSDALILDTLARVYYEAGDLDQAILWQRRAASNTSQTAGTNSPTR